MAATSTAEAKPLSYRWPTWVGLLVLTGYLLYLYKQYDDLHRLNQHELALEVRELQLIVRNAVDTVNKAVDLCRFDADQPYIDLQLPDGCRFKPSDKVDKAAKLAIDGGLTITTLVNGKDTATFRVQLERILAELAFPESFRLVFLARDDGRILYQEAPGSRRWRRRLSWHEQTFRESTPGETEGVRMTDLQKLLGKDPQPGFAQLTAAGSRVNLALGGQSEEVYLQPFTIAGHNLILGGVVSRAELLRRALQVETYLVTLLIFLFFVGVFGYPFIKLYALDRRERFRLRDACLLYLSSGALLALGVFSVLAVDGYSRFGVEADRGLVDLSRELSSRFTKEVGQAVQQLAFLDQTALNNRILPDCGPASRNPHFRWFHEGAAPPPVPAPAFAVDAEQVAWVNAGGTQVFKVTADSAGENVSVKGRNYFQAVRQTSLYTLESGGPEFFAGPSRSITDGKFYTFFSIRSEARRVGACEPAGQTLAAVLTTHLLSLDRQPLPAGYGFALINREGAVLYHSDSRLSLRENLFAELGDSAELKSLVLAGQQGHLDTSYRERLHRLFVSPFTGFKPSGPAQANHLFFVTFRDASTVVATVSYVFLESIVLLLFLILVWTAAVIVVDQVSRFQSGVAHRGGTWLWPQKSLDRFYRFQCFALSALTGLVLLFAVIQREWAQMMLLGGPLFAVVIGVANHFLTRRHGTVRERSDAKWCRNIQWAMLAFWIAFAPAAMIFRLSLAHEFGKLVETDRAWISQQKLDTEKAVRKEARDEEYPQSMIDRLAGLRCAHYQAPPPRPFHAQASRVGTEAKRAAVEWVEHLGELLPIHTETGVRLRAQEFDASYAPPGRLTWWAALLLVLLFATAILWIHWNSTNLFLTNFETPRLNAAADDAAFWQKQWDALPAHRQNLLLQIARDHLPNPKNIDEVKDLLNAGFLRLNPDLEPATAHLAAFLRERSKDAAQQARLNDWEEVNVHHSWHYVRRLLVTGLVCIAFFVVATQPGLQSGLTAGFGLATTALAAIAKIRDALAELFAGRAQAAAVSAPAPPK